MTPSQQIKNAKQRREEEAAEEQRVDELRRALSLKEQKIEEIKRISSMKDGILKEKMMQIATLEEELLEVKSTLKVIDLKTVPVDDVNKKIKAEVHNLEVHDIELSAQKSKLEDKLITIQRLYDDANKILEYAHVEALDKEEMEYMALQIENKKNDLLSSRNYVREMQKIGWSHLPPKVVDECRKTQIELDYVYQVTKTVKDETTEAMALLEVSEDNLQVVREKYNDVQEYNKKLEDDIDLINEEISRISSTLNIKEVEAKDLEDVVFGMKSKIEKAIEEQKKLWIENQLNKEQIEKEAAERREKMKLRNKEVEELKEEYAVLTKEAKEVEEKVSNIQKLIKKQKSKFKHSERKKLTVESITADIKDVQEECIAMKEETVKETTLKETYFNIIEDMLGNLKILCRLRNIKNSNLKIKDDTVVTLKGSKDIEYKFDHVFDYQTVTDDIFANISHFYTQFNDGYNCYIVALGEKESGKTHTILGKNDGLLFLGLEKIRDLIKHNSKNNCSTRMFACAVEIGESKIYDLINNKLSNNFEIKKDCFGMTLIKNVHYSECSTADQVKECFIKAVKNRKAAFEAFTSTDTNFVSILTIQVYNKFQHRYNKGKFTHIKFGSISKNKHLIEELERMIQGKAMNYSKYILTQLLRDCFGGNAKTCVIGCVNPSETDVENTLTTMKLVSLMKSITNEIGRNIESEEVFKLKNNIERLLRGLKQEYL